MSTTVHSNSGPPSPISSQARRLTSARSSRRIGKVTTATLDTARPVVGFGHLHRPANVAESLNNNGCLAPHLILIGLKADSSIDPLSVYFCACRTETGRLPCGAARWQPRVRRKDRHGVAVAKDSVGGGLVTGLAPSGGAAAEGSEASFGHRVVLNRHPKFSWNGNGLWR